MCDAPGHTHEHGDGHDHDHLHGGGHDHDDFRVVVTGKGGVGKTSLTALLARMLARDAFHVLALDADPQMNLPYALGMSRAAARGLVPLADDPAYVEEKTGARSGSGWGLLFRLNPDVHDVVDRFGATAPDGVHVLVMGTVARSAAGCLCPETSLLAAVADTVALRPDEAILLDTQAGVEHFGRALARGFRHAAVVTDPSFNAVQVALQAARLAADLGIPAVHLVVNRVRAPGDVDRVRALIDDGGGYPFASIHALPFDEALMACEPGVGPVLDAADSALVAAVAELRDALVDHHRELSCAS